MYYYVHGWSESLSLSRSHSFSLSPSPLLSRSLCRWRKWTQGSAIKSQHDIKTLHLEFLTNPLSQLTHGLITLISRVSICWTTSALGNKRYFSDTLTNGLSWSWTMTPTDYTLDAVQQKWTNQWVNSAAHCTPISRVISLLHRSSGNNISRISHILFRASVLILNVHSFQQMFWPVAINSFCV